MKAFSAKFLGILFLVSASRGAVAAESKFYLLRDDKGPVPQWCGFRSRTTFDAANQTAQPSQVATLFFSGSALSKIQEVVEAESGDYIVYDDYLFGAGGTLRRLERQTNTFHGDAMILEVYDIGDGKARRRSTVIRDLKTKKPVPKSRDVWFAELPVRTELKRFPYFALLENSPMPEKDKICVKEN